MSKTKDLYAVSPMRKYRIKRPEHKSIFTDIRRQVHLMEHAIDHGQSGEIISNYADSINSLLDNILESIE